MSLALATVEGRVRRLSGIISTDDILPARYKHASVDATELAAHIFESFMPGFAASVMPGDVLVCSDIVGVGSSREQAVGALMARGIRAIVAPIYGRIFYRNCWNLGLPAIEQVGVVFEEGCAIAIDLEAGSIVCGGRRFMFPKIPPMMLNLLLHGGLLAMLRTKRQLDCSGRAWPTGDEGASC